MNLGSKEQRTAGMKKQAQELIEQVYNRGFKAGQENALTVDSDKFREEGRNEAWEAARKIYLDTKNGGLSANEIREIFSVEWFSAILKNFSASEAVKKLRAYEEQKQIEDEIKVGDEVYLLNENYHSVVTCIYDFNEQKKAVRLSQNGKWDVNDIDSLHKTGRHFPEIVEVLKKMKEGE